MSNEIKNIKERLGLIRDETEKISCVYLIECKENGRVYVGKTVDYVTRKSTHIGQLKRGVHSNTYLLEDFQQYGLRSFIFEPVEETIGKDSDTLKKLEETIVKKILDDTEVELYNITFNESLRGKYKRGASSQDLGKARVAAIKKRKDLADKYAMALEPLVMTGESLRVIAGNLESLGIKTRRGNDKWSPTTVLHLIRRIKKIKGEEQ